MKKPYKLTTSKKLRIIEDHLMKDITELQAEYSKNVVAVQVNKKVKDGQTLNRYCIVFFVKKKIDNPKRKIPEYLILDLPEMGQLKLKTDVVEVKRFNFLSGEITIGSKTKNISTSRNIGTLGAYLTRNGNIYALSNYHVYGRKYINEGKLHYKRSTNNQSPPDILFKKGYKESYGILEEGYIGEIDAAIARIGRTSDFENFIPFHGFPRDIRVVEMPNHRGKPVYVFGAISGKKNSNLSGKVYNYYAELGSIGVTFKELICINPVTVKGDSGAAVTDLNLNIIGIIVGSDDKYSYVIPIVRIMSYFKASLKTNKIN